MITEFDVYGIMEEFQAVLHGKEEQSDSDQQILDEYVTKMLYMIKRANKKLFEQNVFNNLKEIEFLARKKFGDLDPNSAFTHFVKEIGEILTAKDLDQFVKELFDVLAMGYSVVIAHGKTHNDFLELFSAKMQAVKERMKK